MPAESVRLDKYLWSVRLFKTRTLGAEACESGRVRVGEAHAKSSRAVKVGDLLSVRRPFMVATYRVLALCDKRQPASLVGNYIDDITPADEMAKMTLMRLQAQSLRDRGTGRPTKKDRRSLEDFFEEGSE